MAQVLSGSMVAIITPMKEGKVDFGALEGLYRIHQAAGTDAVVVCGTTGESATMTHGEHQDVISHAVDFFKESTNAASTKVIAGTGSNATHEAVSLTEFASSKGADAVLVISPYYNKPTPSGQILHFKEVASAAGKTPVILYNVPSRTGIKMNLKTILELAEVQNIVAIKEASGDLGMVSEIVRRAPSGFGVISGEDNLTFPMMALGAVGVISVTANIVPELIREMVHLCLKGDFVKARALHQKQFSLTEALFCETNPIPIKTAINYLAGKRGPGGFVWPRAGEFRLPLCEMAEENCERLLEEMENIGLLDQKEIHSEKLVNQWKMRWP